MLSCFRLPPRLRAAFVIGLLGLMATPLSAEEGLQPYVLIQWDGQTLKQAKADLAHKLDEAGMERLGEYAPRADTVVLVATDPSLRAAAAKDALGGYAAVQHFCLHATDDGVQLSYRQPRYLAQAYRLSDDLGAVAARLGRWLGEGSGFGRRRAISADALSVYNYQADAERFSDFIELASHQSHEQARDTVAENLRKAVGGSAQIYRMDIADKSQTVFGVSFAESDDQQVQQIWSTIAEIEAAPGVRTAAFLPYQILVHGNQVMSLHPGFWGPVWLPEMTQKQFLRIRSGQVAISRWLRAIAGGADS